MRHAQSAISACLSVAAAFLTAKAQTVSPLCTPKVNANVVVVSPNQRYAAGQRAEPPIDDDVSGFAWPDTPLGVIKTADGYEFFGSDGGHHSRQMWEGHWVGNNKWGSFVTTEGTLDNPLGSGAPQDVSVSRNPGSVSEPKLSELRLYGRRCSLSGPAGYAGGGQLARYLSRRASRGRVICGAWAGGFDRQWPALDGSG